MCTQVAKGPGDDDRDDVFVHRPIADADGNVHVGLVNDGLGLGLYWKFPDRGDPAGEPVATFPSRHVRDGRGAGQCEHVGGGRGIAGEGFLNYIQPGEVRTFHMEIGVLDGAEEIGEFGESF